MADLTTAILRELLHYDPETGVFMWRRRTSNRVKVGDVAGCITSRGYRHIGIDGRRYQAHRLAWLYVTGDWPDDEVDHKNGLPGDDRWDNLRPATHAQNIRNCRKQRRNTSGVKGVTWDARRGKWVSQIRVNYSLIYLGGFTDLADAAAAYAVASEKYHGSFGRVT